MLKQLQQARVYLNSRCQSFPRTVVVLGSGMSSVLEDIQVETEILFSEIPHVPQATVQGHVGKVSVGQAWGRRIAVLQGRLHYYEGHSIQTVVFPFRAMALAGAETFLLTNAAGSLHHSLVPPSFLLVEDHINLMGTNPLIGPNLAELGTRFPDLTRLYDPELRGVIQQAAEKAGVRLSTGVYVAIHGPSYETPSEIRMYRQMGGDVVGMSTVPEAIALHHMGKRVAAISCVTNYAAGVSGQLLSHQEVLENAKQVQGSLASLLRFTVEQVG